MKFITVLRNIKGLSLIEILIAMLMASFVTAAVFKVYINQHKNWVIQDEITNMQQNARAAIDELTRQSRMAGHELPLGMPSIQAFNTNPDTIVINYTTGGCFAPIANSMSLTTSDLECDGYDVSCFQDGQMAYIYHPDSGGGEFFEISQVQTSSSHIQHDSWPLSECYDEDAIVVSLEQVKFFIDTTTDPNHPALMMQAVGESPAVYAENITDLQFQYRMKNGVICDVPVIWEDIREIIIDLQVRTANPDPDLPDNPYRSRAYSSRVSLRNI